MSQFDVTKWNKQRYLAEANLLESKAQEAATAIDKILDEVDPSGILPEDLGEAIAIIVKKGYQAELQEKFMDALHKKLGYPKDLNEAKDESYMISKSGSKSYPHYVLEKPDGSKQIDMMFDSPEEAKKYADKNNIRVSSKTGYNMNEAKDDFYPDSPEALRQATQTAKDILDKYKDTIKKIADKYEGQPNKSRQMMDELNDLLDADLKGIPFEDYVSNKVRGVLGKALFRYYASKNPELSKLMK